MNIETCEYGRVFKLQVQDYVSQSLSASAVDDEDYALQAQRDADSAQKAVGRLCEVLARKGILTAPEIFYISNGYESETVEFT